MEFKIAILKLKMIKREWKLPNSSYFTSKSIVQPILQANNPFYTVFELGLPQKVAPLKRSINGKNGRFNYYLRNIFAQLYALNFHQSDRYFLPEASTGFVIDISKPFDWIPFGPVTFKASLSFSPMTTSNSTSSLSPTLQSAL